MNCRDSNICAFCKHWLGEEPNVEFRTGECRVSSSKIMASKKWIAVCQYCGKAGTKRSSSSRPSDAPPGIFGTCKSSPDGKHKPKWEEE